MPPSDPISLAVEQSRAGSDLEHLIQNLSLTILDEDVAASGTSRTTHPPPDRPLVESVRNETHDPNVNTPFQVGGFCPPSNPQTTSFVSNFTSMAVADRAEVQQAIVQRTLAINEILSDTRAAHLIRELGARGVLLFFSSLRNSDGKVLTDAIKDLETAINLIEEQSDPDPVLATLFYCCGCALQLKFLSVSSNLPDLEDAIRYFRRALVLNADSVWEPDKYPNTCQCHIDLAAALHIQFQRLGHVKDIDDAITHFGKALKLAGTTNPSIVPAINSDLGVAYQSRFERLGEHEDLDKAIEVLRLSIVHSNEDNAALPHRLNNLGLSLQHQFELVGENSLLEEGIECFGKAVMLTSESHPEWLSNLGTAYRIAGESRMVAGYVTAAIDCLQRAVDLANLASSDSHKNLPKYLAKLAMCFNARACLTSSYEVDIEKAITLLEAALDATPEYHDAERSTLLLYYGDALQNRYDHSPESMREEEDVSKAMEQFQACSKLRHGPLMARLRGAIRWAQLAHRAGELNTALTAYKDAIQLLPQAAWIGQSVNSRSHILATHPATLAADAAACAIQKRSFPKAVELLEAGRTIFWMQALQLRTDVTELRNKHPGIAHDLEITAMELEPGTFEDSLHNQVHARLTNDSEQHAQHHRRLAERWEELVGKVRQLPGWEDFLKPQRFSDLQKAALCGPVIIANASIHRCDALIVFGDRPLVHVPLPDASLNQLASIAGHVESNGIPPLDMALETLWNSVISPISQQLRPNEMQRVWWCPTGPLTFLPLHMAGSSRGALKSSTANIIPSYTINLGTLIRARQLRPVGPAKLLLVGVGAAPGLSRLPSVNKEVQVIMEKATQHDIEATVLVNQHATTTEVRDGLPKASWAHFACHSSSGSKPFNSSLHLFDHGLLLGDIAQHHLPIANFAFLSACETASGLKDLPEESLHLAAGFQFAGFRSIIATMWSVTDEMAAHVASGVYSRLFEGTDYLDSSKAAEALDLTVRHLVAISQAEHWSSRGTMWRSHRGVNVDLTARETEDIVDGRLIPFVHFGI